MTEAVAVTQEPVPGIAEIGIERKDGEGRRNPSILGLKLPTREKRQKGQV